MSLWRDYEALTVGATAVGISSGTLDATGAGGPMNRFRLRVEGANVRYRMDGTNPTARA